MSSSQGQGGRGRREIAFRWWRARRNSIHGYLDEHTVSGGPSSGLTLNADLTVLVVFYSGNTKIDVELDHMQLDLYFKGHMIGTHCGRDPETSCSGACTWSPVRFSCHRRTPRRGATQRRMVGL
jgi:hypothetical protein